MPPPHSDRRTFLLLASAPPLLPAAAGAAAVAMSLLACQEEAPDRCPPATLSAQDRDLRAKLGYQDLSTVSTSYCQDCRYYQAPNDPSTCGGCTSLAGPIHPRGTCKLFRQKS